MGGKRSIFLLMRENGNGETKHPLLPARWKKGYGNTEGSPADGALKRSCQKAGGSRFSDAEKEDAVCAFFAEKVLKKFKGKVRLFRIRVAHRVFSPKQKPPEEHGVLFRRFDFWQFWNWRQSLLQSAAHSRAVGGIGLDGAAGKARKCCRRWSWLRETKRPARPARACRPSP